MKVAHQNLLRMCRPVHLRDQEVLGVELDVSFVIYVGIGCGTGWGTDVQGSQAVLPGLGSIGDCGWSGPQSTRGLLAHEIGHLAHDLWRADNGRCPGAGPWWQLYHEGFAQWCEHIILGRYGWHIMGNEIPNGRKREDWLEWCRQHRGWLAGEFLRVVNEGRSVRPFFGSWFHICGWEQCGYFLGHEMIKELRGDSTGLKEIALLEDVEGPGRAIIGRKAECGTP
jgi:hypothetical protein